MISDYRLGNKEKTCKKSGNHEAKSRSKHESISKKVPHRSGDHYEAKNETVHLLRIA